MTMNGELATPFRPILRLYQPRASVLDGSYRIPPIRKAGRPSPSASYS
jgi:hypothetical protein